MYRYIAEVRHNSTNQLKGATFIDLVDEVSNDEAEALIEEVLAAGYHAHVIKVEVIQ